MAWLVAVGAATATSRATGQELRYDEVEITPRVIAFVPNEPGVGNAVAILGTEYVVVIDATLTAGTAESLLNAVAQRTPLPISALVYTHWHDDHIWGAQAFTDRFPDLRVLAHPQTAAGIRDQAIPALQRNLENLRSRIAERRAILESGREDGQPLSEERRTALGQRQRAFAGFLTSLENVRPILPTEPVEDSLVLDAGDISVRILMTGRGHTAGDLVIHVPSEHVLITGDLVTQPFPAATEAFVFDWISTLAQLADLEAVSTVVPGHGGVLAGTEYLRAVRALLIRVRDEAQQAFHDGIDAENAAQRVDLGSLDRRLLSEDPAVGRAFHRFFLQPAIVSIYRELRENRSY